MGRDELGGRRFPEFSFWAVRGFVPGGERLRRRRRGSVGRTLGRHELDSSELSAGEYYSWGAAVRRRFLRICHRMRGGRRHRQGHLGLGRQLLESQRAVRQRSDRLQRGVVPEHRCLRSRGRGQSDLAGLVRMERLELEPAGQLRGACAYPRLGAFIRFVRLATDLRRRWRCHRPGAALRRCSPSATSSNRRSNPTSGRTGFLDVARMPGAPAIHLDTEGQRSSSGTRDSRRQPGGTAAEAHERRPGEASG